jgi:uncharacterized protein YjcR
MKDNRTKVTASTLNQMKKLFEVGTKQKHIANAFGVSVSTIQNAKRCNFDYTAYKEFVDGQFKQWKLSKTKSNKLTIPNMKSVTAVSDARMDWIIDKLADIEIRLRTLELENK